LNNGNSANVEILLSMLVTHLARVGFWMDRSPRVFISYSHDSPEHEQAVLDLANQRCGEDRRK